MNLEQQISREEKITRAVAEIGGLLRTMPDDAAAREMMRRANELLPQAPAVPLSSSTPREPQSGSIGERALKVLREAGPDGLMTPEIAKRMGDGTTPGQLREPLLRLRYVGKVDALRKNGNMTVWGAK